MYQPIVFRVMHFWFALTLVFVGLCFFASRLTDSTGNPSLLHWLTMPGIPILGGLWSAGLIYLLIVAKSAKALHVPPNQMYATEAVMKETPAGHYSTIWPLPMRFAVGGKLFLTTTKLVFKAHWV